MRAINYFNADNSVDSVVVLSGDCSFNFLFRDSLYGNNNELSFTSFEAIRVNKIEGNLYLIVGIGSIDYFTYLNLVFIDKDKIIKHILVQGNDEEWRPSYRILYDKNNKEVVIRQLVGESYKYTRVYEVDLDKKELYPIPPEERYCEYDIWELTKLFAPVPDWRGGVFDELDKSFYRVKIYNSKN